MSDGAPSPTTPPASTTPPAGPPQGGQPHAPVPTPPPNPATPPTNGQQLPAIDNQPPANGGDKTFTQADLDRILTERLSRQEKAFGDKLSQLFGGTPTEGDGKVTAEQVLAQAKQIADQAQTRANTATARSFIQAAQIKPERVDTLAGMVDLKAVLQGVDSNNPAAIDAAIKAAVEAKAAEFPEWKAGAPLPSASGGDRQGNNGNGKRIYTQAELASMTQDELAAAADDLVAAAREGRIK